MTQGEREAAVLSMRGVTKRYEATTALNGLDLEVAPGEVVGLLGLNGAGKSTLLGVASGLLRPDAGQVTVAGRDPREAGKDRMIGLAEQEIGVYPTISVGDNLRFFAELSGVSKTTHANRVAEVARELDLVELISLKPQTLSGGQRRRLHVAAALIHRPAMLMLDEPTAGVDVTTREAIIEAVKRYSRAGAGVIYTTHYMPEVEAIADRIAIIHRGEIIASGSLASLAASIEPTINIEFSVPQESLPHTFSLDPTGLRATCPFPEVGAAIDVLELLAPEQGSAVTSLVGTRPSLEQIFLRLTSGSDQ